MVLDARRSFDTGGDINHCGPCDAYRVGDGFRGQATGEAEIEAAKSLGQCFPVAGSTVTRAGIDQGQNTSLVQGFNSGAVGAGLWDGDSPDYLWAQSVEPGIGLGSMQLDPSEAQSVPDLENSIQGGIPENTDGCSAFQVPDPPGLGRAQIPRRTFDEDETQKISTGSDGRFGVSKTADTANFYQHMLSLPWLFDWVKSWYWKLETGNWKLERQAPIK